MNIIENIKVLRLQKRLSQLDVAEALAISQSAYAQLESGKTEITVNRLEQLAKLFGMTVIELLQYGSGVESVKVDSEKVKELEREIKDLKEKIDLLTQLNEQAKEIDKMRKAEHITTVTTIMMLHPETAETFKKMAEDEDMQNNVENLKNIFLKYVPKKEDE
jgi:transcriptional regulator with XRE-family HTH domain